MKPIFALVAALFIAACAGEPGSSYVDCACPNGDFGGFGAGGGVGMISDAPATDSGVN